MEGPCFVQFQNGDFYCGELKKGKFEGVSLFFQKNKETWYHSQYRGGNQQKILNKSAKSNNEMKGRFIYFFIYLKNVYIFRNKPIKF